MLGDRRHYRGVIRSRLRARTTPADRFSGAGWRSGPAGPSKRIIVAKAGHEQYQLSGRVTSSDARNHPELAQLEYLRRAAEHRSRQCIANPLVLLQKARLECSRLRVWCTAAIAYVSISRPPVSLASQSPLLVLCSILAVVLAGLAGCKSEVTLVPGIPPDAAADAGVVDGAGLDEADVDDASLGDDAAPDASADDAGADADDLDCGVVDDADVCATD